MQNIKSPSIIYSSVHNLAKETNREAYISAQQKMPQNKLWFPQADEDCRRAQNHQSPPSHRPQATYSCVSKKFSKESRLVKRRDFEKVSRSGSRKAGKWVFVDLLPCSPNKKSRLGITVTKKFGKSHDRNRFKRVVREAFRLISSEALSPFDLIVRPKGKLMPTKMQDIKEDLRVILHNF